MAMTNLFVMIVTAKTIWMRGLMNLSNDGILFDVYTQVGHQHVYYYVSNRHTNKCIFIKSALYDTPTFFQITLKS